MPVWLSIIIAVVGAIIGIFGGVGLSAYLQKRMSHKAEKKNQKEDEAEAEKLAKEKKLEAMKHEEYKAELKLIINDAIAPIIRDLESIKTDLALVKTGVQVTCRSDLEDLADKAERQKFMSAYDKQRFENTYKSYHALGENGVMDAKRDRILAMPEYKPENKKKSKTTKKTILVE